jgi:hypothetical protein
MAPRGLVSTDGQVPAALLLAALVLDVDELLVALVTLVALLLVVLLAVFCVVLKQAHADARLPKATHVSPKRTICFFKSSPRPSE